MKKLDLIIKITDGKLRIPPEYQTTFMKLLKYCNEKRGGYMRMQLSPPFKHRSTGEGSQNHAINGYIQQIANETGDDFAYLKLEIKKRAIKRGYPFETSKLGDAVPLSETEIDTEQAGFLIEEIKEVAAFLNIKLKENMEDKNDR